MSKVLQLTFLTESGKEMELSIPAPVADLKLATVKTAAADMIPALQSSAGEAIVSLKSAKYETTTVEEITA